jgi:Caspase domain/Yqey-like protein
MPAGSVSAVGSAGAQSSKQISTIQSRLRSWRADACIFILGTASQCPDAPLRNLCLKVPYKLGGHHMYCRIWYSIFRTVSEHDARHGNIDDCSARALAVKPRAFGGRLHLTIALALFASFLSVSLGRADNRVALVVGNAAYRNVSTLATPVADAKAIADSLGRLDFSVNAIFDATYDEFRRALIEFGRRARGADLAIIYFAGHGIEINGDNGLVPVDAELKNDIDAANETIELTSLMRVVSGAKKLGLVILDACRSNQFKAKMQPERAIVTHGLGPIEPSGNVVVAYAAIDGTTAKDGVGPHSLYTATLLRHIETPSLEIDYLFRNVRDDVAEETHGQQQPHTYGSPSGDELYLAGLPAGSQATAAPPEMGSDQIAWSFLSTTSDIDTLHKFVFEYPNSAYLPAATARIALLEQAAAPTIPDNVKPQRSLTLSPQQLQAAMAAAIADVPKPQAVARRFHKDTPAIESAWKVVRQSKDPAVIRRFADQFPTQQRRVAARDRLIDLGQSPAPVRVRRLPTVTASDPFADPSFGACLSSSTGEAAISACRQAYTRFPDIPIVRVRLCGLLGSEINCQLPKPMAPGQGTMSGSDTGSGVATATTDPPQPATPTPGTSDNNSLGKSGADYTIASNSAPGQQPSPSTNPNPGAELLAYVGQVIQATGATSFKDTGKVMAAIKRDYAGEMDFSKASGLVKVVKAMLSGHPTHSTQANVGPTSTSNGSSGFRQVGSKVLRAPVTAAPIARASISSNAVKLSTPRATSLSTPKAPSLNISTPRATSLSTPKVNVSTPKVNVSTPKVNVSIPKVNVSTPKVNVSIPKVNVSTPKVNVSTPNLNISKVTPQVVTPRVSAPHATVKVPTISVPTVRTIR